MGREERTYWSSRAREPRLIVEEASMKNLVSRTGFGVAVATAAMSIICLFVPWGYPWPSVAWAMLTCVAAVWVAKRSNPANPSMSDVISRIEAESPRVRLEPARAVRSTKQAW